MTKMRWSIRRSSGKYSEPPSARRGRAAACLFVRNRMRKGSGERKGERRELPKQYVDHSPGVKGGDRPEGRRARAGSPTCRLCANNRFIEISVSSIRPGRECKEARLCRGGFRVVY